MAHTTTAAVNTGPGTDFDLREVTVDGPRAGEALVQVVATGLCHTDLGVRDTLPPEMFPRVFGHEGAGVIEAVGEGVTTVAPGDHVVMSFRACRECARCQDTGPGYCENTTMLNYLGFREDGSTTYQLDGAPLYGSFFGQSSFSRLAVTGADNLIKVDPALDLRRLGPFGCSFQTGAGTVLNVLRPGETDTLVVYGVGAVGLAALAAGTTTGARLVAVDLKPERRAAAEQYGAITIDPTILDSSLPDHLKTLTGGGATHAVDTTGVAGVIKDAVAGLRQRGTLVVLGLGAPEFTLDAVDVMMNGKVVRGSCEGDSDPQVMIPRLLGMVASGELDLDRLITPYSFEDINRAVADLESGAAIKPVLVWD